MADKIIIFSGKQYSGKDTAAKILMEAMPSFKRCAMGDVIKLEYGRLNNVSYEEIEANKPKYRQGLIDLGNWGRGQDQDYWLKKIVEQEGNIVVTDVRMKHEYEVFKQGGKLVGEDDVTEVDLDDIQDWDYIIDNNKDYETLKKNVLLIVQKLG